MGWSFRRSVGLGKGLRLNLSSRGVGLSGGICGFRIGIGPRGKRLQVSIPGTGICYRKEESWRATGDPDRAASGSLTAVAVIAVALAVSLVAIVTLVALLS